MQFVIDLMATTNDESKFAIAGKLLASNETEAALIAESAKVAEDANVNSGVFSAQMNGITYSGISISNLSAIISTLERALESKISVEFGENCKFMPAGCRPLARKEVAKRFK